MIIQIRDQMTKLDIKLQRRELHLQEVSTERDQFANELRAEKTLVSQLKAQMIEMTPRSLSNSSVYQQAERASKNIHDNKGGQVTSATAKGINLFEQTMFGKTQNRGNTVHAIDQHKQQIDDPIRNSVLVAEGGFDYEMKKRIVKSVVQRLDKGNIYQRCNDLIDTSLIMFQKQLDTEMLKALQELKGLTISLGERFPVDRIESTISSTFNLHRENDIAGLSSSLSDIDRLFVLAMFEYLPDYLGRTQSVHLKGGSDISNGVELQILRRDNENLKKDMTYLKDQKMQLEKIIE